MLGAVQLSEEQEFRLASCEDTHNRRCPKLRQLAFVKTLAIADPVQGTRVEIAVE